MIIIQVFSKIPRAKQEVLKTQNAYGAREIAFAAIFISLIRKTNNISTIIRRERATAVGMLQQGAIGKPLYPEGLQIPTPSDKCRSLRQPKVNLSCI